VNEYFSCSLGVQNKNGAPHIGMACATSWTKSHILHCLLF